MPSPVVLHLSRPYANADEYLRREAWSIDTRSMLLVEQAELLPETDIVFDVTLADGSKPIRAEAKVVGMVEAADGRPGGLRVRFKRYGAATRAFVERAVSARSADGDAPSATPEPPSAEPSRESVRPPPSGAPPPASMPPAMSSSAPAARSSVMPAWEEDKTSRFTRPMALAAPMTHPTPQAEEISPPSNRDALLERLRKRAKETEGSGS